MASMEILNLAPLRDDKLDSQIGGVSGSCSGIIGDNISTMDCRTAAEATFGGAAVAATTPEVVVPPEEAVPCCREDTNDGESRTFTKELDSPITTNDQNLPLVRGGATADGNKTTVEDGSIGETQVILKHMLQRLQQQELSIQQLQSTVQSQNNTLQTIMTTMQAGFAALLEKERAATEPPLKRLISPERDHPILGLAKGPDVTPDTLKESGKGTEGHQLRVPFTESADKTDKDMLQSTQHHQNSIKSQTQHNITNATTPMTSTTTTERPALRIPHRATMSSTNDTHSGSSTPGMSPLDMLAYTKQKTDEDHSMLRMPTMGLKSKGSSAKPSEQQQSSAHLPAFGKKSSSLLLDDDDDDSDDNDDDDDVDDNDDTSTLPSHDLPARSRSSCRLQLAKPSPKYDTVPSPPIYFPSPLNHNSANRMATRLSRATSAPLANFTSKRRAGGGGKPGLPKLPPRLPTREDSISDGLDDNGGGGGSTHGKQRGNKINPNFFLPMPAIARAVSSPRLPLRKSFAKAGEGETPPQPPATTAVAAAAAATGTKESVDATDKIERKASSATTSTASTMPRMPTRNNSVNKELDLLGCTDFSLSTVEDDIHLDGSENQEKQQQQQQQQHETDKDSINNKRCMPRLPSRHASVSEGLDAPGLLGCMDSTDVEDGAPATTKAQTKRNSTRDGCKGLPLLDEHDDDHVSSLSPHVGSTPERHSSQSSLSWSRFKQLAATSSQQTNATSFYCSEEEAALTAGRQTPRRNSSRGSSFLRGSSLRGSRREIFAKQGLAHLHVSCVTLDSALVDEAQEWIGDEEEDDETSFVDESGTDQHHHHELVVRSTRICVSCEGGDDDNDNNNAIPHEVIVVDSKELADGSGDTGVYTGSIETTDNLPHGNGIMHYDNGKYYKGNWQHGNWHGSGQLLSANGDNYKGDFVQSTRHGHGVYSYDNGDTYDGTFSADKPHGIGVFKFADNSVYQGGFKFGSFDGQGWYEFDGGRYDGEWKGSCYDGNGTLQFGDGACYTGQFQAGKAHGLGEEVSAAGLRRKGQWKHGDFIKQEDY